LISVEYHFRIELRWWYSK